MKKQIILTIIFLVFILLMAALTVSFNETERLEGNTEVRQGIKKFHQALPADREFYEAAFKQAEKPNSGSKMVIVGGIVPHHLLASGLIANLLSQLKDQNFETIILIGPNHFLAGKGDIITSTDDWKTPYGILPNDSELTGALLRHEKITVEEDVFNNEHSIFSEASFLKKVFPRAKFVPLVLKPWLKEPELDELARTINQLAGNKKILLLSSVDFSHNTDSATAQANDKQSIKVIENFSFPEVYQLKLDSHPAIYLLMRYAKIKQAGFKLAANSNSEILSGLKARKDVTSYITGYFLAP